MRWAWTAQPERNLDTVEMDAQIRVMQKKLAELTSAYQNVSDKVENSGREGFAITLVDVTKFDALHARIARKVDLLLVKLPIENCLY